MLILLQNIVNTVYFFSGIISSLHAFTPTHGHHSICFQFAPRCQMSNWDKETVSFHHISRKWRNFLEGPATSHVPLLPVQAPCPGSCALTIFVSFYVLMLVLSVLTFFNDTRLPWRFPSHFLSTRSTMPVVAGCSRLWSPDVTEHAELR